MVRFVSLLVFCALPVAFNATKFDGPGLNFKCRFGDNLFITGQHGKKEQLEDREGALGVNRDREWMQKWKISDAGNGKVYITSYYNKQLEDRLGVVGFHNDKEIWQKWKVVNAGGGKVFIVSHSNKYLMEHNGHVVVDDHAHPWIITNQDGDFACKELVPQDETYNFVSMPGFLHLADIADSSEAPCKGNIIGAREAARRLVKARRPQLVTIQRPCGGHDLFDELEKLQKSPPPWVLLYVDGDYPLTAEAMKEVLRIGKPRGLKKVFATNMAANTPDLEFFEPQPQGMCYHSVTAGNYEKSVTLARPAGKMVGSVSLSLGNSERLVSNQTSDMTLSSTISAIESVKAASAPFEMRTKRLFLGPQDLRYSQTRRDYDELLRKPEYAHLVERYDGPRLSVGEFMKEIARHKAVLSLPGIGYDCYRHWEALAVGTVPLVLESDDYDMRLWKNTGARFIPEPSKLTPAKLKDLLDSLEDPSEKYYDVVTSKYWQAKWRAALYS
jgi:hypothetical protein